MLWFHGLGLGPLVDDDIPGVPNVEVCISRCELEWFIAGGNTEGVFLPRDVEDLRPKLREEDDKARGHAPDQTNMYNVLAPKNQGLRNKCPGKFSEVSNLSVSWPRSPPNDPRHIFLEQKTVDQSHPGSLSDGVVVFERYFLPQRFRSMAGRTPDFEPMDSGSRRQERQDNTGWAIEASLAKVAFGSPRPSDVLFLRHRGRTEGATGLGPRCHSRDGSAWDSSPSHIRPREHPRSSHAVVLLHCKQFHLQKSKICIDGAGFGLRSGEASTLRRDATGGKVPPNLLVSPPLPLPNDVHIRPQRTTRHRKDGAQRWEE